MKSFYKLSEIELEKLKKETDQITIYDEKIKKDCI